ncbi:MAG: TonB-dependent receptor [Pigmentiphaga sp.]|nr:TonB-dependent receptor [Pigmentiphaga sp.]
MSIPSPFVCSAYAGLLLAACASTALAQTANILSPAAANAVATTDATTLPAVTVVASRSAQSLPDVLGDVTIIDRHALDAAAGDSVADVLRRVPGIQITTNGGPQTVTRVFMRGANSNQTLVLVDGLRINAATNGGAAINALALADIERIEVLRGAASSLYGADAIGGVINIITRQEADKPFAASASVGFGSDRHLQTQLGLRGRTETWRYAVQAGYAQSRGTDATRPDYFLHNPDRDSYYQRNVTASVGHSWHPGQDLDLQVFHSRINGGYDAGLPWFGDRSVQSLDGVQLSSRNRLSERWTSTLRLGWQRDRLENRNAPASENPDNPPDGVSRFRSRQTQIGWQNDFALNTDHHVSVALERLAQHVGGDLADFSQWPLPPQYVDYADTRRHTNSVVGVYRGSWQRHHLQASLRFDRDSQYGSQTTGGLAYGFDLTPALRLGLAASTAFRAPDFNELYYPGAGNPDLKPERSRNLEASLRYQHASGDIGVTVFRNRVRDLIAGFPSANIQRAILEGVTLSANQQFGNTSVTASVDLQNPHNADTGELLPLRAKRVARLGLSHQFGAWEPSLDWYASSSRRDTSSGEQRLAGYALLDLGLGYRFNANTQVQLRWNNVFDRDYTLVSGYTTPGSNVFVILRHQM